MWSVDQAITEAMAAGERASAGRDRALSERIDKLAAAMASALEQIAERLEELESD